MTESQPGCQMAQWCSIKRSAGDAFEVAINCIDFQSVSLVRPDRRITSDRHGGVRLHSELRSCVKVEVALPNKPTVSVDVKQHPNKRRL